MSGAELGLRHQLMLPHLLQVVTPEQRDAQQKAGARLEPGKAQALADAQGDRRMSAALRGPVLHKRALRLAQARVRLAQPRPLGGPMAQQLVEQGVSARLVARAHEHQGLDRRAERRAEADLAVLQVAPRRPDDLDVRRRLGAGTRELLSVRGQGERGACEGVGDAAGGLGARAARPEALRVRRKPGPRLGRAARQDGAGDGMTAQHGTGQLLKTLSSQELPKLPEGGENGRRIPHEAGLPQPHHVVVSRRRVAFLGRKPRKAAPELRNLMDGGREPAARPRHRTPSAQLEEAGHGAHTLGQVLVARGGPLHRGEHNLDVHNIGKRRGMGGHQGYALRRGHEAQHVGGAGVVPSRQKHLAASHGEVGVVFHAHPRARVPRPNGHRRAAEPPPGQVDPKEGVALRKLLEEGPVAARAHRPQLREAPLAQNHHGAHGHKRGERQGLGEHVAQEPLARALVGLVKEGVGGADAGARAHEHGGPVREPGHVEVAGDGEPAAPHAELLDAHLEEVGPQDERPAQKPLVGSRPGSARDDYPRAPARPEAHGGAEVGRRGLVKRGKVVDEQRRRAALLVLRRRGGLKAPAPSGAGRPQVQPDGLRGPARIPGRDVLQRPLPRPALMARHLKRGHARRLAGAAGVGLPRSPVFARGAGQRPHELGVVALQKAHHLGRGELHLDHGSHRGLPRPLRALAHERRLPVTPRGLQHDDALAGQPLAHLVKQLHAWDHAAPARSPCPRDSSHRHLLPAFRIRRARRHPHGFSRRQ